MKSSKWRTVATTAGLLSGLALATPAAALQCGDTIGPNVSGTLSGSIVCDDVAHGLTIVGPANLTLDGLYIFCQDLNQNGTTPSSGIRILGRNVRIDGTEQSGGSVIFCRTGVEVAGEGRHKVEDVSAGDGSGTGFHVTSDDNTLKGNHAINNSIGFSILGNDNTLRDNTAEDHQYYGFNSRGDGTELKGNVSLGAEYYGFLLFEASRQRMTNNYASNCRNAGFRVERVEDSSFRRNSSVQNRGIGIDVQNGQRQTWVNNVVRENQSWGIFMESNAVRLTNNEVVGNASTDIVERATDCGTNIWRRNVFGVANRTCVE